jgi:cation:H+ antiporter
MTTWVAVVLFVAGATALVRIGAALAVAGDELAEHTRLGRLVVGTLLMAFATSLPEIATDVTAAMNNAPDLAVGDLFGSSMANMAILAIVDLRHRGRVWPTVELGHARVAAVAIVLTALAALAIRTPTGVSIGWVGLSTVMIGGLYVAAMAWLRRAPIAPRAGAGTPIPLQEPFGLSRVRPTSSLRTSVIRFSAAASGILVAAPVVALSAKHIADATGLEQTFVGTTLLAVTTSLPELIVALAAVRIGAHDLAVGNLFGSNAANMTVLLILDLVYLDGPILAAVDPAQTTAAIGAILLMALAVAALVGGTETRIRRLEPDAIVLLVAYIGAVTAVALAA